MFLFYFSDFFLVSIFYFIKLLSHVLLTGKDRDVGEVLVKSLQNTKYSINEKLENSFISFFGEKPKLSSEALADAHGTNNDVEQTEAVNTKDLDGSESSDQDEEDTIKESEASGSDDEDSPNSNSLNGDQIQEHIEFHDGRRRRRAIFGNDIDQSDLMVSFKQFCLFFGHTTHASHKGNIIKCFTVIPFPFFFNSHISCL